LAAAQALRAQGGAQPNQQQGSGTPQAPGSAQGSQSVSSTQKLFGGLAERSHQGGPSPEYNNGNSYTDDSPRTANLKPFKTNKNLRQSIVGKGRRPGRQSTVGKQFNIPMDMGDLETGLERSPSLDTKQYSMHKEMNDAASMHNSNIPARSQQNPGQNFFQQQQPGRDGFQGRDGDFQDGRDGGYQGPYSNMGRPPDEHYPSDKQEGDEPMAGGENAEEGSELGEPLELNLEQYETQAKFTLYGGYVVLLLVGSLLLINFGTMCVHSDHYCGPGGERSGIVMLFVGCAISAAAGLYVTADRRLYRDWHIGAFIFQLYAVGVVLGVFSSLCIGSGREHACGPSGVGGTWLAIFSGLFILGAAHLGLYVAQSSSAYEWLLLIAEPMSLLVVGGIVGSLAVSLVLAPGILLIFGSVCLNFDHHCGVGGRQGGVSMVAFGVILNFVGPAVLVHDFVHSGDDLKHAMMIILFYYAGELLVVFGSMCLDSEGDETWCGKSGEDGGKIMVSVGCILTLTGIGWLVHLPDDEVAAGHADAFIDYSFKMVGVIIGCGLAPVLLMMGSICVQTGDHCESGGTAGGVLMIVFGTIFTVLAGPGIWLHHKESVDKEHSEQAADAKDEAQSHAEAAAAEGGGQQHPEQGEEDFKAAKQAEAKRSKERNGSPEEMDHVGGKELRRVMTMDDKQQIHEDMSNNIISITIMYVSSEFLAVFGALCVHSDGERHDMCGDGGYEGGLAMLVFFMIAACTAVYLTLHLLGSGSGQRGHELSANLAEYTGPINVLLYKLATNGLFIAFVGGPLVMLYCGAICVKWDDYCGAGDTEGGVAMLVIGVIIVITVGAMFVSHEERRGSKRDNNTNGNSLNPPMDEDGFGGPVMSNAFFLVSVYAVAGFFGVFGGICSYKKTIVQYDPDTGDEISRKINTGQDICGSSGDRGGVIMAVIGLLMLVGFTALLRWAERSADNREHLRQFTAVYNEYGMHFALVSVAANLSLVCLFLIYSPYIQPQTTSAPTDAQGWSPRSAYGLRISLRIQPGLLRRRRRAWWWGHACSRLRGCHCHARLHDDAHVRLPTSSYVYAVPLSPVCRAQLCRCVQWLDGVLCICFWGRADGGRLYLCHAHRRGRQEVRRFVRLRWRFRDAYRWHCCAILFRMVPRLPRRHRQHRRFLPNCEPLGL
jgi:hypothetical protein